MIEAGAGAWVGVAGLELGLGLGLGGSGKGWGWIGVDQEKVGLGKPCMEFDTPKNTKRLKITKRYFNDMASQKYHK